MNISYSEPAPDAPDQADLAREACLHAATVRRPPAEEADLVEFIERGATQLTPRTLQQLVAELPGIRKKIKELNPADFPYAPAQLAFLADVVESFAEQRPTHENLPFQAVMEAAFALQYLLRSTDLIPDTLGTIGYTDDAAVASAVITRHAVPFAKFARGIQRNWSAIYPAAHVS